MREFFVKRDTYILSFLMGSFFAYIGTTVFIPVFLEKAISPTEAVKLPPPFTFLFFVLELLLVYLGILVGAVWTQKIQRRRPVMAIGGVLAGLTALIGFIPPIHDSSTLSNIFKMVTIFFVCINLAAWTYTINEVSKESGKQIGAILSIAAIIGCIVPILQSFLLSIDLFELGWVASSTLLLLMGVFGYLAPETGETSTFN